MRLRIDMLDASSGREPTPTTAWPLSPKLRQKPSDSASVPAQGLPAGDSGANDLFAWWTPSEAPDPPVIDDVASSSPQPVEVPYVWPAHTNQLVSSLASFA